MADNEALAAEIRALEARSRECERNISWLNGQLADVNARIAELEKQLRDADSFRCRVSADWGTIRGHVNERSSIVKRFLLLNDTEAAIRAANGLNEHIEGTLRKGVENNLASVHDKVLAAIRAIRAELEEAYARRASILRQISDNQAAIRQNSWRINYAREAMAED